MKSKWEHALSTVTCKRQTMLLDKGTQECKEKTLVVDGHIMRVPKMSLLRRVDCISDLVTSVSGTPPVGPEDRSI